MASSSAPETREAAPNKERRLGPIMATVNALLHRPLAHYPRFPTGHARWEKVPDENAINRVVESLSRLEANGVDLAEGLARGRETLDEVKTLTEYQDQKATRLLTIITFLSALSGILFARFVASYPLRPTLEQFGAVSVEWSLIVATYALFGVFAFLAICGALITFHATRTQFRYPDVQGSSIPRTKSYLF